MGLAEAWRGCGGWEGRGMGVSVVGLGGVGEIKQVFYFTRV